MRKAVVATDALLPAAPVLLGPEAKEVLRSAVEFGGGRLHSLKSTQVQYRPGRSLAVLYQARVSWGKGPAQEEGIVAMTAADGPPEGSLPVEAEGMRVGVWRLAHDPMLPGLKVALSNKHSRQLLGQTGGMVGVSLRSYRPTRRAVVRLRGTTERYVKVVRPDQAAALRDIHDAFVDVVSAPVIVYSDDALGLLCFEALPGRPMVDVLVGGMPLPSGKSLLALLDQIADLPSTGRSKQSPRKDAAAHCALLATMLPEQAERLEALLASVGTDPPLESLTVHGDFYEAQLLVDDDGHISGVLDLDRAGVGARADDLATMLAHLDALGVYRPKLAERCTTYRRELWATFSADVDPDDLRQRVAAVLIGLASGPFRLRHPRWQADTNRYLSLVDAWLDGRPDPYQTINTTRR